MHEKRSVGVHGPRLRLWAPSSGGSGWAHAQPGKRLMPRVRRGLLCLRDRVPLPAGRGCDHSAGLMVGLVGVVGAAAAYLAWGGGAQRQGPGGATAGRHDGQREARTDRAARSPWARRPL